MYATSDAALTVIFHNDREVFSPLPATRVFPYTRRLFSRERAAISPLALAVSFAPPLAYLRGAVSSVHGDHRESHHGHVLAQNVSLVADKLVVIPCWSEQHRFSESNEDDDCYGCRRVAGACRAPRHRRQRVEECSREIVRFLGRHGRVVLSVLHF